MWVLPFVLTIVGVVLVCGGLVLLGMAHSNYNSSEENLRIGNDLLKTAERKNGMTIATMVIESHSRAQRKGFVDSPIPERIALIHSEASEMLEDYRVGKMTTIIREDGKPEGFPSELADVCIRCFDLAGQLGIDLEKEIRVKSDYNETRPLKHGNKVC